MRRAFLGGMGAMMLACFLAGPPLNLAVAADGPRRSAESKAVLVEIEGWQIFAQRVTGHGTHLRFEDVQASRGSDGRWRFVADRLIVRLRMSSPSEADWMWASGRVRLSGPDDLYVRAPQIVALEPARKLWLVGDRSLEDQSLADRSPGQHELAALIGTGWQLPAARIEVDLEPVRVRLEDVSPTDANE